MDGWMDGGMDAHSPVEELKYLQSVEDSQHRQIGGTCRDNVPAVLGVAASATVVEVVASSGGVAVAQVAATAVRARSTNKGFAHTVKGSPPPSYPDLPSSLHGLENWHGYSFARASPFHVNSVL